MAKPAQSRCHSFGRLLRLLAVRRARAANSKTSFCALDHVAALPRLLSNDEAEALADCTACSSCLVSVLCVSSEWWRCVCGVLGTGSSRSPRRSGIRVEPKSAPECHRVEIREARDRERCRFLLWRAGLQQIIYECASARRHMQRAGHLSWAHVSMSRRSYYATHVCNNAASHVNSRCSPSQRAELGAIQEVDGLNAYAVSAMPDAAA